MKRLFIVALIAMCAIATTAPAPAQNQLQKGDFVAICGRSEEHTSNSSH